VDYKKFWKWGFSDVLFSFLYGKDSREGKDEVPSKIVVQTHLVTKAFFVLTVVGNLHELLDVFLR
jgi:hypothetical protein